VRDAVAEWGSAEAWAPALSALAWRGGEDVLGALHALADGADPRERMVAAAVAGRLGMPVRTQPAASAALLEELGEREVDPAVLAVVADAFGQLGEPWGLAWLLRLRRHPDAAVRDGVVGALAGRTSPLATEALAELSADPDPDVRDWATFALGALAAEDSRTLREALAARLDDADAEIRIEAVHGLAMRDDDRALAPAVALLAAGERGRSRWTRHALRAALARLAARTGDPRLAADATS
jgi:HEAT repeat protein